MSNSGLEYYMAIDYPAQVVSPEGDDEEYFSCHPDLPGCMSSGATREEAVRNLQVARELWIETRLERGDPIPEASRT